VRGRLLLAAAVVLLVAAAVASAGQPSLTVQLVPERFGVEDVARLRITVEGGRPVAAPEPPALENLRIVGGPSVSQQFSFVNGVASSSVTYTYLVQAEGVGKATVGPVEVEVDGKTLESEPITVTVVEGSVAPPRRRVRSPFDPFGGLMEPPAVTRPARIVLRMLPARRKLVRGEPLAVTVALDTTAVVEGFEWSKAPAFPGWWSQRIDRKGELSGEPVEVDGVRYMRYRVARYVLIPLSAGTLELPACSARIGMRGGGFLMLPQVVERSTRPVRITVDELPPPPEGFHDAVGNLRYQASLDPATVRMGSSAMLTVTLRGQGNLPLAGSPFPWPAPDGLEIYPPEESASVRVTPRGPKGSRTWKAVVLPSRPGRFELSAVPVAVFDPRTGQYRTARLGPFTLEVEPPPATPAPVATPAHTAPAGATAGASSPTGGSAPAGNPPLSLPLLLLVVGAVGAVVGGVVAFVLLRRRGGVIPPRPNGQDPTERARALQGALEGWWHGLDSSRREDPRLRREVEALRRELEAVRFAPGRADHSETVAQLEERLRRLLSS